MINLFWPNCSKMALANCFSIEIFITLFISIGAVRRRRMGRSRISLSCASYPRFKVVMKDGYPYIPETYHRVECPGYTFYASPSANMGQMDFLQQWMIDVLAYVKRTCGFENRRQISLCCFQSNEEARMHLDRPINETMAMAPYSDEAKGLIIVQSGEASPLNLSPERMRRVLAHEVCHLFVSEMSGGKKILGDGNMHIKIPSWLDEGFAEVVSNLFSGRHSKCEAWLDELEASSDSLTFKELSQHLDDLWSDLREAAFRYSGALVYGLVRELSADFVFRHLPKIAESCREDHVCSRGLDLRAFRS